ncbi:unnamed protein product, partial [Didymodactylos carnosus]
MSNDRFTLCLLLYSISQVYVVHSAASNSLSNCNAIAAKFSTTYSNGPAASIISTTGTNVTCASLTGVSCPGSTSSGSCVFQHKLCITCYMSGSTVKIRVQSNGLPLFCPNIPSGVTLSEQNIDFSVNFNPDVSVNSPYITVTTQTAIDSTICNVSNQATPPSASGFTAISSTSNGIAGVSIDGVAILNANSANNVDPFYPSPTTIAAEHVDQCMGHPNPQNIYHYHIGSGCALSASQSASVQACATVSSCISSISTYSISQFSSYKTLTVIGIAKDGHVIYGPYDSSGNQITSGYDVC